MANAAAKRCLVLGALIAMVCAGAAYAAVPTVSIGAPSATVINSADTVSFVITYTGATAITLAEANITVNTYGSVAVGTVTLTKSAIQSLSGTVTIDLTGITGNGALSITLPANTGVNPKGVKVSSGGTGAVVCIGVPHIAISMPTPQTVKPGGTTAVVYTVTYTVSYADATAFGLDPSDITLNATGSAKG